GTDSSPTVPLPNAQTADGNPASGSGGQAFNPTVVQQATTTSQSGGLLGGLLGVVKTVATDVLGLLHDGAGAFDLLDVPGSNYLSHPPACCCRNCGQSVATHHTIVSEARR